MESDSSPGARLRYIRQAGAGACAPDRCASRERTDTLTARVTYLSEDRGWSEVEAAMSNRAAARLARVRLADATS